MVPVVRVRSSLSNLPLRGLIVLGVAALLALAAPAPSALAQSAPKVTASGKAGSKQQPQKRLTVEAREIVYDNDHNTVAARGDVILYYDGRKLEADRVTYDRNTRRVFAQGNAHLTELDGTVAYGDRFELTDDFRDGFVDSLRVLTKTEERFSSPRAERSDGETAVFELGTYTACKPCAEHPERPPLWQVRAARIIHKNSEQTIYYEDANLEFYGLPVLYIPYFSSPDPSVNRRTGFLAPSFLHNTSLGVGAKIPFFWAIAPNYDVTFAPTIYSRQGLLLQGEWRQRLENGQYSVKIAGIHQLDRKAFLPAPAGPGDRTFRGSIESVGRFYLNKEWSFGWDVALQTDRYFFQNYKIKSDSNAVRYLSFKDSTSTAYLNGQTDRAWFDLRGYYFQGLTVNDWQKQSPVVFPVLDYNRRFDTPKIGGELSLTANFVNLHRDAAAYSEINPANPGALTRLLGYYDGCATYNRNGCILRGIAGDYRRFSTEVSWRKEIIDPIGQVWTPFASARFDAAAEDVNLNGFYFGNTVNDYANARQSNFIDASNHVVGRALPSLGLNYRFPFVATTSWGSHVIEPIAQIITAPNETKIGKLPNEDAQSLVFDDTNLFALNRFSGYDRIEGGTRASAALQYTTRFNSGGYVNALFGQSYHIAGRNSFEQQVGSQDLANTGSNSGLDKSYSDYVGRFTVAPDNTSSLSAHARFDSENWQAKRIDVIASKSFAFGDEAFLKSLTTSINYTRILPQPLIGYDQRREGVALSGNFGFSNNWYVNGTVLFDLDRHLYNEAVGLPDRSLFNVAATALGFGYKDECTTFAFNYISSYANLTQGQRSRSNTFMFRLELKNLGDVRRGGNSSVLNQSGLF